MIKELKKMTEELELLGGELKVALKKFNLTRVSQLSREIGVSNFTDVEAFNHGMMSHSDKALEYIAEHCLEILSAPDGWDDTMLMELSMEDQMAILTGFMGGVVEEQQEGEAMAEEFRGSSDTDTPDLQADPPAPT